MSASGYSSLIVPPWAQAKPLSPQEIGELGLKLQTINDTLADCEDQWLLLSEQIEAES